MNTPVTELAIRAFARSGGIARAKRLTAIRRREIAKVAIRARWDRAKKKKSRAA